MNERIAFSRRGLSTRSPAIAAVILSCQLVGSAEVAPPDIATEGGHWELGPELISNGTFEADTVGSTPSTWELTFTGPCVTTNAAPYGGSLLMHLGNGVRTTYTIPTASNRYYRYEVYWRQNYTNWGPNLRIGLLDDPGIALSWPNGVKMVNGYTNNDGGGEPVSAWHESPWPNSVTEMANGRQPVWRGYTYVTNWHYWRGTIEVLPTIANFNSRLRPTFRGDAAYTFGVDDISLRQWMVVLRGTVIVLK